MNQLPTFNTKFTSFIPLVSLSLTEKCAVPQCHSGCRSSGDHYEISFEIVKFSDTLEKYTTGWWFGTFFIFPCIGKNHPNWLIFFGGVETTNQTILLVRHPP
jgi:hypothetical protein